MIQSDNVVVEKKGCIALIKIDNPPQNFLKSPAFMSMEHMQSLAEDDEIKGIVISGTGRHFSAGADLENLFTMAKKSEALKHEMTAGSMLLEYISGLNIPVAAAIKGACWGGGLEIAMSCHIRFASSRSLFAFPEINSHLIPGLGGVVRLVNQSGNYHALSLLLSGDIINADEALKYNLVHQLYEEDVLEQTIKYVGSLVESKPKKVITSVMQAIHNANKLPLHEALHEETRMFCELAIEEAVRRKSRS